MVSNISEPCPFCGKVHQIEPSSLFMELGLDGKLIKYIARPDVFCSCKQILRWTVPIIKTTESGHELRVKARKLSCRLSSNLKQAHWDEIKVGVLVIVDEYLFGEVTQVDEVGHVWVDGKCFPFTVEHSFKIPPVL